MKQVYQARDAAEAHFVRAALEARGVRAVVQGENLQLTAGEVPFFLTTPTVHVNDEDADAAGQVVAEVTRPRAVAAGDPWQCPTCGETVDAQFTACWRCAADQPIDDEHFTLPRETCRECGYLLRGLPEQGACPECGAAYRRVSADDALP